jgi:hypothetical protein
LCNGTDLRDVDAMGDFVALGFTPFVPTPSVAPRTDGRAASWQPGGGGGCPSDRDGNGELAPPARLRPAPTSIVPYDAEAEAAWRRVTSWNGWLIDDIWFDIHSVAAATE